MKLVEMWKSEGFGSVMLFLGPREKLINYVFLAYRRFQAICVRFAF